jgi:hypothetical protein
VTQAGSVVVGDSVRAFRTDIFLSAEVGGMAALTIVPEVASTETDKSCLGRALYCGVEIDLGHSVVVDSAG